MHAFKPALFFLFLMVTLVHFSPSSMAATEASDGSYLLVIVSQRNAETVAEITRAFLSKYPNKSIQARTDAQLSEYEPEQLKSLLHKANALFATGLYGPSVALLTPHLSSKQRNQIIINSDHRLVDHSSINNKALFDSTDQLKHLAKLQPESDYNAWLQTLMDTYPKQSTWIQAKAYWQSGGAENGVALMGFLYNALLYTDLEVESPQPMPSIRWFHQGTYQSKFPTIDNRPVVAVIDHAGGARQADSAMLNHFCQQAETTINHQCVAAVANWGGAGIETLEALLPIQRSVSAIVSLHDFVIGGGEGRAQATEILKQLKVPLIKAIKLRDRSQSQYDLSYDGIAQDKVYYQVAMPELQGASQPLILATAGSTHTDQVTGIRIQPIVSNQQGVESILKRVKNWHTLQTKPNSEKRIALIYYNHPPGRHNIGADNLDVPASLWTILNQLKEAGYQTGELPPNQAALLDLLQEKGVNLPRNTEALATMANKIEQVTTDTYREWFRLLPEKVQQEMIRGPFGLLHQQIQEAIDNQAHAFGLEALEHSLEEMHHLLEGLDHPGRERADELIESLEACYENALTQQKTQCLDKAPAIIDAIRNTGIEGFGGWGHPPGSVMVTDDKLLLPGIQFGNVFVGPQPPRGWEINEELLHANLAFPPPHQYLAFYHFIQDQFKADAMVHLGRHSTYEFLPRRSVGVGADDYSRIIAGDLPGIYPYIVDGVGEGIQAKRRGLAVIVDHLTPPLKSTPLYDELLQLRQLVESFESHHGKDNRAVTDRLITQIREKIASLDLKEELAEAMSAELAIMGIGFDEVDDDMLVHEIGHYLTDLQERFMPLGLHIFGKNWETNAVKMMLESMAPENKKQESQWKALLEQSPAAEIQGLTAGLDGRFIEPGQGNDPIRSPNSLPTGRNFFALDSSLIPSRTAWQLGKEMAQQARQHNPQNTDKREAVILWASDVVRDEGVMIAFGLNMLGLEPQWNSRGLVTGLKRLPIKENRVRRDTVFTTSGLFRDLYGNQMRLLNQATLMALDASADIISRDYPALVSALNTALEPLNDLAQGGDEPLDKNQVAAHWVEQTRQLMKQGLEAKVAGVTASYRVFGDAPGSYGAGINRLAERSGAWEKRAELAKVYVRRLGHSYGIGQFGVPAQKAFEMQLAKVENTYFGRSSNLYGLIDNNDAFDYLGGLSLAVETLSGKVPNNFVIDHSDPQNVSTQPLKVALRQELRGRFLNPEWLEGLMKHGYAGARTMGSEFIEYLWGWQITNPTLVGDWAWEEVKAVYMDDRYKLELDRFLEEGHNAHVKTNMLAVMLVAIHKDFWNASDETRKQLAQTFANLVIQHGLPGSGHTDPDHPMLPWLQSYVSQDQWQQLNAVIKAAKPAASEAVEVHRLTEVTMTDQLSNLNASNLNASNANAANSNASDSNAKSSEATNSPLSKELIALLVLGVLLIAGSAFYATSQARRGE